MPQTYFLRVTAQDSPHVLFQVSSLLRRKRFKVKSLNFTALPNHQSQFNITLESNKKTAHQAAKLINQLIEVHQAEIVDTL